ncbi:conserved protein of unknown function [Tenacibaculum sp. 190524A02b]|uniref:hypothetical protein n=1 Tax=Tenacibaculum vairaonense TaxID=3137860 RepID=UPI0032B12455
MNTYSTSDGTRLKQSVIERLIRKAKGEKLRQQFDDKGYNFCEECGVSNGTFLDCSHDESVKSCKENGRVEKAFDVNNITIRCRECHQEKDGTNLKFKSKIA